MVAQKLKFKTKLEIIPTRPFHFDSTFYKPGHFPSADTKWQPGKRWQTMLWRDQKLGLIFEDKGAKQKPKVLVKIFSEKKLSSPFLKELKQELIWRYNLNLDLSGFYKLARKDRVLKPAIKRFYGLRPMHSGSLYEYLIIAIVLQNTAVKRSVSMMQTLFENYGSLLEFDKQQFWCFWEPKKLARASEQKLRKLKMGYRAKSLIRVSQPFAKNQINELTLRSQSIEDQAQALISLYGIGLASVGYIMFDVFHQWDYLNHISPWEQKIYSKIFFNKDWEKELVSVEEMLKYFAKWRPWQNLAVHYLWEDIWWTRLHSLSAKADCGQERKNQSVPWLEKLIRL